MNDPTRSLKGSLGGPNEVKRLTRRVPLVIRDTLSDEVRVTGDFTDWVREGIPLSHDGDGLWSTVLTLEPGEHQYRLLVDGEWKDREEKVGRADPLSGSKNCMLKVD
jgi:hypothetical protein